jgi:uncharacterized protein with HEPN domain
MEAAEAIERFLHGKTEANLDEDEMLRSAIHAKLIIIGEAVSHLTSALTDKYPNVPWQKITGFRNFVVHGYFKIDWDIIWNTATQDVPALRATAARILEKEFPQLRPENL